VAQIDLAGCVRSLPDCLCHWSTRQRIDSGQNAIEDQAFPLAAEYFVHEPPSVETHMELAATPEVPQSKRRMPYVAAGSTQRLAS
jgi:hypothetical protein